jgi:hypothetical protein
LAKTSDRWFFWLVVSSILVGAGVCLEAPEATIALKRWYLHWIEAPDIPPENERRLAIPIEYLGLLLVILGVIGEGVCELGSSSAETALRAHDEQVLGETILAAGDAKGVWIQSRREKTEPRQPQDKYDLRQCRLEELTEPCTLSRLISVYLTSGDISSAITVRVLTNS